MRSAFRAGLSHYRTVPLIMPPPGQTGRHRHYDLNLSVRPSVCYKTCEYDISKK